MKKLVFELKEVDDLPKFKTRRSSEEYLKLLDKFLESGMKHAEVTNIENLNPFSVYYMLRKKIQELDRYRGKIRARKIKNRVYLERIEV